MKGWPIWYELMVADPATVAPFYQAVLGWVIPPEGGMMPNGSEYRLITRADGGTAGGVLTLSPAMIAGGASPGWLPYFATDDVDGALALATAAGARLWLDETMPGIGRMAMLSDPEGAPFYAMDPDGPDGSSDVFRPDTPGHCVWNELNGDDPEALIGFYGAVFGWAPAGEMPMPEGKRYAFLACGGTTIGAIGSMKAQGASTAWLPYFQVASIDAAGDAARASGGAIVHGPHPIPGGEFMLIATDPGGALVGLVGPRLAG